MATARYIADAIRGIAIDNIRVLYRFGVADDELRSPDVDSGMSIGEDGGDGAKGAPVDRTPSDDTGQVDLSGIEDFLSRSDEDDNEPSVVPNESDGILDEPDDTAVEEPSQEAEPAQTEGTTQDAQPMQETVSSQAEKPGEVEKSDVSTQSSQAIEMKAPVASTCFISTEPESTHPMPAFARHGWLGVLGSFQPRPEAKDFDSLIEYVLGKDDESPEEEPPTVEGYWGSSTSRSAG